MILKVLIETLSRAISVPTSFSLKLHPLFPKWMVGEKKERTTVILPMTTGDWRKRKDVTYS